MIHRVCYTRENVNLRIFLLRDLSGTTSNELSSRLLQQFNVERKNYTSLLKFENI